MGMKVNIEGLDVADVLVALWENSRSQGFSRLGQYSQNLTKAEAEQEIAESTENNGGFVDYVNGRVIKCKLYHGATEFDSWGYDRDNGPGAAQKVIDQLRR